MSPVPRAATPPVFVTGMHRSGTTMLVNLLTRLGGFFGSRLDPNTEDFFFMRRNEWVLRRAGGAWDYPLPAKRFLAFERFFEDALDLLRHDVASPRFGDFSGGRALDGAWGFKDPRNVFTLGLWTRVFPGARLVYIRRNGVDAANSLFVRERARWRERGETGYLRIRPLMGRWRDALKSTESFEPYLLSTRCLTLEDSFALWEEYVGEGEQVFDAFDGPKLALGYEAFIAEPEQLEAVARFCGLAPAPGAVAAAVAHIDRARSFAFVHDPALREFYEKVRGTRHMQALGYGEITGAMAKDRA
ncbi:MAG: sulfotransferase [Acidobacteria bacterium]|nr:sulfotransferase [Acidobacteriota bacterium]